MQPDASHPASVHTFGGEGSDGSKLLTYYLDGSQDNGGYFPVQSNETTQPEPGDYAMPVAIWPSESDY